MVSLPVTWVVKNPFGIVIAELTIYDLNVTGSLVSIDAEYKKYSTEASRVVVVWQQQLPKPGFNPLLEEIGTIPPGRHREILRLKKPITEYPFLAFSLGRLSRIMGTIDLRKHIVKIPRKYEIKPIIGSSGNYLVLGVKCTWYNRGLYPIPPEILAYYNIVKADTGKWIRSVTVSFKGEGEKTEKIRVEPGNYRITGSIMVNRHIVLRINRIVNVGAVKPIIPRPKPISQPKPKPVPKPVVHIPQPVTTRPEKQEKEEEKKKPNLLPLAILLLLGGKH